MLISGYVLSRSPLSLSLPEKCVGRHYSRAVWTLGAQIKDLYTYVWKKNWNYLEINGRNSSDIFIVRP